jgi:membrane-associated phospholipid phosphatase
MDWKRFLMPEVPYTVWKKCLVLSTVVAFYTVGYLYLNYTTIHSDKFYDVSFAFEQNIPFVYHLVPSYIFVYFLVIALFLAINSDELLLEAAKTFVVVSLIHFAFFYFLPVKMVDRPVLVPTGGIWNDIAAFWFWADEPTTLFPSAHVSMAFLSAYYIGRVHRGFGIFCIIAAAYVGASVVLIKQHYVADVIAGFFLASACYHWFYRKPYVEFAARLRQRLDQAF